MLLIYIVNKGVPEVKDDIIGLGGGLVRLLFHKSLYLLEMCFVIASIVDPY